MIGLSKLFENKKSYNINNHYSFSKLIRDSNCKENSEKDLIIQKIISNADEETESVTNSELSLNLSETLSNDNSTHSIRISKHSYIDSILTIPSQTYRNNKEEKSSERRESSRQSKTRTPISSSTKRESNLRRGNTTERGSVENNKHKNYDRNYDNNNENFGTETTMYLNNITTKRELSERSIFYTPSTICNYYQKSYDVTPKKNATENLNQATECAVIHKFKLNFKNLNVINITNSNNNCNTSNTNSNFYEENINDVNENISSSSRFNINTFDKRSPIKYIKTNKAFGDTNKKKGNDEKTSLNMHLFNFDSSPSVVSHNFNKQLNISEIEIDDRSIDINEEMQNNFKTRYHTAGDIYDSEKKNLINAFDRIKDEEIKIKENFRGNLIQPSYIPTSTQNLQNIPNYNTINNANNLILNIIRNENFSFDMTNKPTSFNKNSNNNEYNYDKNMKTDSIYIENNSNYDYMDVEKNGGINPGTNSNNLSNIEDKTFFEKSNKNKSNNKFKNSIKKNIRESQQYYSLNTTIKTSTVENFVSTGIPSSNKSQQSSQGKFKEVRPFEETVEKLPNLKKNNSKDKTKKNATNLNLTNININQKIKTSGSNTSIYKDKIKNNTYLYTEPTLKRSEQSKSPSYNYDKSNNLSKQIISPFDRLNKNANTVFRNKYNYSSQLVKENKFNRNTIENKSKISSEGKIKISSVNNRNNKTESNLCIKKIINENIIKNNLNKENKNNKPTKNDEKWSNNQSKLILNLNKTIEENNKSNDSNCVKKLIKNDSLKIITNFSQYKKTNKEYFEYIPKKIITKDACLQTSPCKNIDYEQNTKSLQRDVFDDARLDKMDLRLNKEIIFSKLLNPKGDEDIDICDD